VGRVRRVQAGEHGLAVVVTDAGTTVPGEFDAVVSCLGSSVLDLLATLVGVQREELEQRVGAPFSDGTAIQRRIDESLALPGLQPYLHVPAAGTLRFGPGLANLSCLGTLSDRILAPYLSTRVAAEAANTVVEAGV
jgi:mycobactin lysine-N-oxygenase